MKRLFSMITLALLATLSVRGEGLDSLTFYVMAGDSCMQQYNTYEGAILNGGHRRDGCRVQSIRA